MRDICETLPHLRDTSETPPRRPAPHLATLVHRPPHTLAPRISRPVPSSCCASSIPAAENGSSVAAFNSLSGAAHEPAAARAVRRIFLVVCPIAIAGHALVITATRCRHFWRHTRGAIALQGCARLAAAVTLHRFGATSYLPGGLASVEASLGVNLCFVGLGLLLTPRARQALARRSGFGLQALALAVVLYWAHRLRGSSRASGRPPQIAAFSLPLIAAAYLVQHARGGPRLAKQVWTASCVLVPVAGIVSVLLRPTAAVQLEKDYRLSLPPLKFVAGLCCGLMHSLQPYSPSRSLLLAGVVVTLLSAIPVVAYLRTYDTSWLRGVPHPLAVPFALPTLCAHAVTSFWGQAEAAAEAAAAAENAAATSPAELEGGSDAEDDGEPKWLRAASRAVPPQQSGASKGGVGHPAVINVPPAGPPPPHLGCARLSHENGGPYPTDGVR